MVSSVNLYYFCKSDVSAVRGHPRSSKVIDFGTNWKRVCDFLLVRHSNLGPILHRFGDIPAFMCSWLHPYSTLILGCSRCTRPWQIAHVGASPRKSLSLFGREIIFEVFQPMGSRHLNVTDRQRDGQTTCNLITAFCIASRGKISISCFLLLFCRRPNKFKLLDRL